VLHSFKEGPGTLITTESEDTMEQPVISGIAFNRDEAKLTITGVPDIPGVASKILGPISDSNVEVDMILQNVSAEGLTDFTFTVHRNDYDQAFETIKTIAKSLNAKGAIGSEKIAKVSIVGVGMRSHAGVASRMFESLANENINIQMISTSEIKVSVVIDEKYLELAVRALHSTFEMDQPQTVEE
jgi:aspartate kinase